MKHTVITAVYLLIYAVSYAQEQENIIAALEQHAEMMTENEGTETEDDSFMLHLENLKKHPVNLNKAGADDLKELPGLSDLQIGNFLNYRHIFGDLLDVYELQAIPTWNIQLIKKLLPFIAVAQNANLAEQLKERWRKGSHSILLRTSRVLEKSEGYTIRSDSGNHFMGNPDRLTLRYAYNYRNMLQWGVSGDKDAGERFFKGNRPKGFDFYSFHFFLSKTGIVKALAIGDFTINIGQGLVQWQSLAFSKSAAIASVKRQSAILHPYTATGEFNFHRGAAVTLQKGRWEGTSFVSFVTLSGNLVKDSITDRGHISSILSSGFHRTRSEQEDRNTLRQATAGVSLRYAADRWQLALNSVHYKFSLPLKKDDKPYNRYAATGKNFGNGSVDYSYTYKNLHFFGEYAVDRNYHTALVNGLLASLSQNVDFSLLYRSIHPGYQSFYTNAFTENTDPVNEKGVFAALSVRPSDRVQINGYADHCRFPWLKYRVDAPSSGREYFFQLIYTANKQVELYGHFRSRWKQQNVADAGTTTRSLGSITSQNWRIHSSVTINRAVSLRSRAEIIFYNKKQFNSEEGFLMFTDVLYKPVLKPWSANMRLEYFETDGYNSRLYAFENDVLYNFSIPAVFDKGYRYYVNLNVDLSKYTSHITSKKITTKCWVRVAQTVYDNKESIGSGPDEIKGNTKTELKIQLMMNW